MAKPRSASQAAHSRSGSKAGVTGSTSTAEAGEDRRAPPRRAAGSPARSDSGRPSRRSSRCGGRGCRPSSPSAKEECAGRACGSRGSGPASVSSSSARSRTVRAIGPSVANWCRNTSPSGIGRHPPEARAKPVDVAEGRRVAQRPHDVRAVGHRHQPRRQRRRRAAARAAGGAREVVGVAGDADAPGCSCATRGRTPACWSCRSGSPRPRAGGRRAGRPRRARGRRRAASRGSCGCPRSRPGP